MFSGLEQDDVDFVYQVAQKLGGLFYLIPTQ